MLVSRIEDWMLRARGEGPVSLEEYSIHVVGGVRDTGEEKCWQWLG